MGHTLPTRTRSEAPSLSLPPRRCLHLFLLFFLLLPQACSCSHAIARAATTTRTTTTRDDDAYTRNYSGYHARYFFLASSAFFSLSRANDSPEEGEKKIARRVTTSVRCATVRAFFLHGPEGRVRCSGKDFLEGNVRKSRRSRSRMRNKARHVMACHVSCITPSSVSR